MEYHCHRSRRIGKSCGACYYMGLAHLGRYYFYGLMVDEDTGWDSYGESFD